MFIHFFGSAFYIQGPIQKNRCQKDHQVRNIGSGFSILCAMGLRLLALCWSSAFANSKPSWINSQFIGLCPQEKQSQFPWQDIFVWAKKDHYLNLPWLEACVFKLKHSSGTFRTSPRDTVPWRDLWHSLDVDCSDLIGVRASELIELHLYYFTGVSAVLGDIWCFICRFIIRHNIGWFYTCKCHVFRPWLPSGHPIPEPSVLAKQLRCESFSWLTHRDTGRGCGLLWNLSLDWVTLLLTGAQKIGTEVVETTFAKTGHCACVGKILTVTQPCACTNSTLPGIWLRVAEKNHSG